MAPRTRTRLLNRRTAMRLGSGGLAAVLALGGQRLTHAEERTTLETNKALVSRIFDEVVNDGNETALGELYALDYVDRSSWARQMPGPIGMPLPIDQFHTEFPDVTVTVEMAVAENDLVATVAIWRGTHPPAGTHVVGRTMHCFRIANEMIVEEWSGGWEWITSHTRPSAPRSPNPLVGT